MEDRMTDLNELLDSTESKLKIDIDAKYEDQMKKIKSVAGEIGHFSNVILQSNNRLEKVYWWYVKAYEIAILNSPLVQTEQ